MAPFPPLTPLSLTPHPSPSRRQASRISRKQRRLPDIVQAEEILHDAIQAQPAAAMRTATPLERLRVMPEPLVVGREALRAHAVEEVGVDVDALGAGHDFLAAHEEVIGVCEGGVVWGRVRVERPEGARVLVDSVEVRFVLFEDEFAEGLFLCGAADGVCQWGSLRNPIGAKGRIDGSTGR